MKALLPRNAFGKIASATPHTAPTFRALLALLDGAVSIVAVRVGGVWKGWKR